MGMTTEVATVLSDNYIAANYTEKCLPVKFTIAWFTLTAGLTKLARGCPDIVL